MGLGTQGKLAPGVPACTSFITSVRPLALINCDVRVQGRRAPGHHGRA
jgi:hypothetical protein